MLIVLATDPRRHRARLVQRRGQEIPRGVHQRRNSRVKWLQPVQARPFP